jgi:hypothetical protein
MIEKSSINSDLSLYLLPYSRCSHIKHSYKNERRRDVFERFDNELDSRLEKFFCDYR